MLSSCVCALVVVVAVFHVILIFGQSGHANSCPPGRLLFLAHVLRPLCAAAAAAAADAVWLLLVGSAKRN
jgi:hypothetical protein